MVTIFGLPAVEVEQPSGEIVKYLALESDPQPHESRAWNVTQELGTSYRVALLRNENWICGCRDFFYRQRRCRSRKDSMCKHTDAVAATFMLAQRTDNRPRIAHGDARDGVTNDRGSGGAAEGLGVHGARPDS